MTPTTAASPRTFATALSSAWFREWGLEQLLIGLLGEYPLLPGALTVLAFRQARSRNEEGAEMYVSGDNVRNAMIALRMDGLERDEALLRFLRHEFMHGLYQWRDRVCQ